MASRNWVSAGVVLLTVFGMLLELASCFLPWYIVYIFDLNGPTRVVPYYLIGSDIWGSAVGPYASPRELYAGVLVVGSVIGLAALGTLTYLYHQPPVLMVRNVALFAALLLPWFSVKILFILCGFTTVPGSAIPEIRIVPVLAVGVYADFLASVLLLLALGFSLAAIPLQRRNAPSREPA